MMFGCRSRWTSSLRHGSVSACFVGLLVRIPRAPCVCVCVCVCLVSVRCCQVEVFATGRSLAQRIPTEFGVSECDIETSTVRMSRPTSAVKV